jgi:ABC-2 type transport system ATP-binding protein
MLEIENLTKRFDTVTAVAGLSLSVGQGEVLGFLGPNGAGKTTTMKMVTGFLRPDSGTVRVCGHDIGSDTLLAQAKIGYLPEGAPLYSEMTPREFLAFIARTRGLYGDAARAAKDSAVAHTGLEGVMDRPIEALSKGFRRRVGLAQAILHDPEVLVLDEPTDGLDPNQKHAVRDLIRGIAVRKTIVISTHMLEEVQAMCSRAVIINRGTLVADGTPGHLAARAPSGRLDDLFRALTSPEEAAA